MNYTGFCSISTLILLKNCWGARHYFGCGDTLKNQTQSPCHHEALSTVFPANDGKQIINETNIDYNEHDKGNEWRNIRKAHSQETSELRPEE